MQCPLDGETLLMTSREGVEIDYCPRCRGVWLDRGELDKIIERSVDETAKTVQHEKIESASHRKKYEDDDDDDDDDRRWSKDDKKRREKSSKGSKDFYKKSKKHASFIKELFDF